MDPTSSPLPDQLANISPVIVIAVVMALTLLRLCLAKVKDQWARTISETCDTINFVLILAFLLIRPFVAQAFYIPSESMENTLLVRDRLIVDKLSYRFTPLQRHDVVVFEAPPEATTERRDGIDFIKRLIGESGDTIQVKEAKLIVDGEVFSDSEGRDAHGYLREKLSLGVDDSIKFFPDHVLINNKLSVAPEEIANRLGRAGAKVTIIPGQTLLNGEVQNEPYTREDPSYNFPGGTGSYSVDKIETDGSYKIPAGDVFMMGDNRNRSADSHVWGPLEKRRVVGKARVVFWPLNRIGAIR
ncbi:MAG: signal peptidase I [Armatimonadota bacterium]